MEESDEWGKRTPRLCSGVEKDVIWKSGRRVVISRQVFHQINKPRMHEWVSDEIVLLYVKKIQHQQPRSSFVFSISLSVKQIKGQSHT